jgi:hypothetical protein
MILKSTQRVLLSVAACAGFAALATEDEAAVVAAPRVEATTVSAHPRVWADFYGEGLWRQVNKTVENSQTLRVGPKLEGDFEAYAVARWKGDTRTMFNAASPVLTDAALFGGAGVDWLLLPGARLTAQAGYSADLSSKINKAAADFRVGWVSFHEMPLTQLLYGELYTEALYDHRSRTFAPSVQPRLYLESIAGRGLSAGPLVTFIGTETIARGPNSAALEARLGARLTYKSRIALGLYPHYAWVRSLQNGPDATTGEWRGLAYASTSF